MKRNDAPNNHTTLCLYCGQQWDKHKLFRCPDGKGGYTATDHWEWYDGTTRRVYWLSDDKTLAVVDCGDLDPGVARSQNESTPENAKKLVDRKVIAWRSHPGGGTHWYAIVRTADVPWTLTAPLASTAPATKASGGPTSYETLRKSWNAICNDKNLSLNEGLVALLADELAKRDVMIDGLMKDLKELRALVKTPPLDAIMEPAPFKMKAEKQCYCGAKVQMVADVNKCTVCGQTHTFGLMVRG